MMRKLGVDHLPPEPVDLSVGRLLGTFHHCGEADHIGRQNRR